MKPRKAIKRSVKPIKRRVKPRVRRGDPAKRRWASHRDRDYQEWIWTLPCFLEGNPRNFGCTDRVECMHVKARSTGGDDVGNILPACGRHHRAQHLWGIKTFASFFDVDLQRLALKYGAQYRKAA